MVNIFKKKFNALVKKHINSKLDGGVISYPSAQQLLEIYEMRLDTIETNLLNKVNKLESELRKLKETSKNDQK